MLNVKVCKKLGFFVTRYTRYINTGFIVIWKKELHCMIPKLDGFKGQLYELVLPWRTFGPSYDSYLFTILELKLNALYIIQRHEKALEVSPQEMQKLEISNFKMTTKNTFLRSSTSLTIIWSLEIGILRGITLLKFRLHSASISPFQMKDNMYCYSNPILKILGVCQAESQQYTYNDKRVKFIFASKNMHAVLW